MERTVSAWTAIMSPEETPRTQRARQRADGRSTDDYPAGSQSGSDEDGSDHDVGADAGIDADVSSGEDLRMTRTAAFVVHSAEALF